jgi:hypothetical protein
MASVIPVSKMLMALLFVSFLVRQEVLLVL